ncbi:hypothetical protein CCAL6883_08390 [Campylobacter sp. RM6883]|uniref:hypothetical protein n=1 Tax=Campylobacter californiensis TaxID=1032243 RepID=UPI0014523C2F|nr:hypothetical protein [Campylobacter sp. RM6914]MBE2985354.1 hypothetical protein [Campylobacter sp. RM6883]MBE2995887.1 hypothetical protein [Campylobacter sp. RM6913]QCD51223.1 hypothetical protein CCAL_1338 [Campylobacter sp. RM6914]
MATMDERKKAYGEIYTQVLANTMDSGTPYDKFTVELKKYHDEFGLKNEKYFETMCNALVAMTQTVTTSSQQIALQILVEHERLEQEAQNLKVDLALKAKELELAEKRLLLADKEATFNEARTNLLDAQKKKEEKSIEAIEREIRHYDDKLRIQEATILKDVVFGYTAGGLVPPTDMTTKALNAIDKITP